MLKPSSTSHQNPWPAVASVIRGTYELSQRELPSLGVVGREVQATPGLQTLDSLLSAR